MVLDFKQLFPVEQPGLRIGRGTLDRLTSRVNDDLTGLETFHVRVMGHRHYPATT